MKNVFIRLFGFDRIINGLITGLVVPIVLFATLLMILETMGMMKSNNELPTMQILRPRTLALLALCLNLVFMQNFNKMRWYQSMRGLAISTFVCIVLWLAKYYKELF